MIDQQTFIERQAAFTIAQTLVQPIYETCPLEAYRITTGASGLFTTPPGSTMTTAEQAVNITISVADWLLDTQ